ncbi:glycoside hydrolase family 88 protein [Pedobacter sp. SD-b]|uniref:Glycoside hydrolase family 88 protein n=1 Tax=Pedobacter segetis TaxID=2793069 RepID=A0ABS1BNE4_9SPHI|nr:glycoside hydrolase family 88 protein [Pedobacter segetis]MBK0384422.1 glycoside hydrolase family 88 protein [Pedobacter segetis]
MMKILKKLLLCSIVLMAFSSFIDNSGDLLVKEGFNRAQLLYTKMLSIEKIHTAFPRTTAPDGTLKTTDLKDWTAGFWAGDLWQVYEYTKDPKWKEAATKWTVTLKDNQFNKGTHDLGFMMFCSYGNAYRLTGDKSYRDILIQSAKSLSSRYNPITKCIESWDQRLSWDGKTLWKYPVIIDNMMNLELLFWATKETGDSSYYKIAISHANATMKNHVRPDFSTYHVVNYDEKTGEVLDRQTCQGFADNSTWARGQAWAIYGFTIMYRETMDKKYLDLAQNLADFFLNNKSLPKDKIPLWDFNVNQEGYKPQWDYNREKYSSPIPRDASAAAITSSALFELSTYLPKEKSLKYKNSAIEILRSLSSSVYLAIPDTNNNFLIKHSVGSLPHKAEIDVPLNYADYYYLESLLRYKKLNDGSSKL